MFDRVEKGIERAVSGAFAKAFRSEVQPVEIASALRREVDDRATIVGRGRTLVPNTFVVELGAGDHERLGEWQDALSEELQAVISDHAGQQRYSFVGPVSVAFEEAEDLDTGLFRVRSTTTRAPGAPAGVRPGPAYPPPAAAAPGAPPAGRPASDPPAVGPAATARITLEIEGRLQDLTNAVTVLGRGTEADVVLDDPGVSRRHAEIRLAGGRASISDLGSTNGVFVDGDKVQTSTELLDGSQVTMGRSRIVVHVRSW